MDESTNGEPYVINGPVIDLFDPKLPALAKKSVDPGTQGFVYNISRVENKKTRRYWRQRLAFMMNKKAAKSIHLFVRARQKPEIVCGYYCLLLPKKQS